MDCLLCYHVILMLLGSIAFCLLWVGYSTPGWMAVTFQEAAARQEYTVSSLNRSLWYDVLCPQELYDCKTCLEGDSQQCVNDMAFTNYTWHYGWIEELTKDKEQWLLWRILMTLCVVCCTIGFIFVAVLVCLRTKTKTYRAIATIAFFLWLIPAIFVWIPVAMDADMHDDIESDVDSNLPHDATLHVPYSLVIVAVGAFIALIVAIMLLWLTGCCSKKRESDVSSESYSDNSRTKITAEPIYGHQYPVFMQDNRPSYYYRQTPYPEPYQYSSRPAEEVVVSNPDVVTNGTSYVTNGNGYRPAVLDNRSVIYSERWYDNKSAL